MDTPKRPINRHDHYHAHVYFDAPSLAFARQLRNELEQEFELELGTMHQRLVGPHTMWSFQVLFDSTQFESLITWLDVHRGALSVLVHADTGDDLVDHTQYAYWLGCPVKLDLSQF
ncbi:4,5-dioxygenase [Vibrio sp. JPW-9-11-11]|uniref:DOPA 4,5-dioxygenase family protein n=1 Tax=Vibrio sp. JPW-9-11-11 TaxID=1416532 RepID=UPI0015949B22|nr:DOPA 4,5-dioxygenase family protein [Vibrio sp. JPW-9-11-11]NVD07698.1 4,5-dioxygenase [Vibrio sp. JPW-9-11-11]